MIRERYGRQIGGDWLEVCMVPWQLNCCFCQKYKAQSLLYVCLPHQTARPGHPPHQLTCHCRKELRILQYPLLDSSVVFCLPLLFLLGNSIGSHRKCYRHKPMLTESHPLPQQTWTEHLVCMLRTSPGARDTSLNDTELVSAITEASGWWRRQMRNTDKREMQTVISITLKCYEKD